MGACLARKEGMRHEYAELIFELYTYLKQLNVELIGMIPMSFLLKTYTCFLVMKYQYLFTQFL